MFYVSPQDPATIGTLQEGHFFHYSTPIIFLIKCAQFYFFDFDIMTFFLSYFSIFYSDSKPPLKKGTAESSELLVTIILL